MDNNIIYFFNKETIKNTNITFPDIYFTPEYCYACEFSDNAEFEICVYKDLMYVYLKKIFVFEGIAYYDLITPYGYSGYHFANINTYYEFIPLFRNEAFNRNYLTEVVRQNPYLIKYSILSNSYDIIISKTIMGIKIDDYNNFEEYLKDTHYDNSRGYRIATNNNLIFKIEEYNEENLNKFLLIYNSAMDNLKSEEYYYFNENYYKSLNNLKNNIMFANVYKDNVLISSYIIFKYNYLLHFHLCGSLIEYRKLLINNFLYCNVVKFGIENGYKLCVFGGGLKDGDNLFQFKKKIKNVSFNYVIYKNIINKDVYEKIQNNYEKDEYFPIHRK